MKSNIFVFTFLLFSFFGFAQNYELSGKVVDSKTGEVLLGVNIINSETKNGVTTDFDGNFKISNNPAGSTLIFRYLGYNDFKKVITTSEVVTISLVENVEALKDIVVVGYSSKTKKEVTGSVGYINSKTIEDLRPIKAEQALQGTVAGVYVSSSSGAPGAGLNIRIRGISSNGENGPLVLIDGAQGNMELLNPSDIESYTVLKDAQAAVYGAVGANGVILITTKQGKKNAKTTVSFNSYTGFQETTKKIDVLNAQEYALLLNESYANAGLPLPYNTIQGIGKGTNWQNEVFQKAPIINNDISISGGSEKITYAFSASKIKQDGIVGLEKSGFDRSTARIALGVDLSEKLKISTNFIYTDFNRQGLNEGGLGSVLFNALNTPATLNPYDSDGNYTLVPATPGFGNEVINPLAQINNTYNSYNQERLNGNIKLEYKLFKDFKITSRYGFQRGNSVGKTFNMEVDYGTAKVFNVTRNYVRQNTEKFSNYTLDLFAEYEKSFLENHKVKATVGGTLFEQNGEGLFATGFDVPYNSWDYADIALANGTPPDGVLTVGSYKSTPYKRPSLFGNIDYDFKGKYLLSLILRRDQSSRFGPDNSVAFFKSVLGGWIISDEEFFNKESKVNFLKLRGSYGTLGNDAIGDNNYRSLLTGEATYVFDNSLVNGTAVGILPNPAAKWEADTKLDIGVDAKMFNNTLEVTADYFNNTRKDLLILNAPISGIVGGYAPGSGSPAINAGTVNNKGFELDLKYKNNTKDFNYSLGFNITTINNEVTEVNNSNGFIESGAFGVGQSLSPTRMEVGQPMGVFYGYQTDGIFQNQAEVNAHPSQEALGAAAVPGDIRFKDVNGDGKIDVNDRTYIGDPIADFTLGFNMNFNFKGFDFVAYSYASVGNDMIRNYERTENKLNRANYVLGRWTGEGTSNEVPRVTAGASANNVFSDYFVEDASFFRIQNIQLGYSIPAKYIEKIGLSKVRLYGSINNVYTFTKYRGYDPAANSGNPITGGIDYGYYPTPRVYMLGLNVNF